MTALATGQGPWLVSLSRRPVAARVVPTAKVRGRLMLGGIICGYLVLELVGFGRLGYQIAYYAAGDWAGSRSWQAFWFAGLDPSGGASVDKPALGFWLPALSVRMFGMHEAALLLPQIGLGVLAVLLLFDTVKRLGGSSSGLIAAAAFALTPVVGWMFRTDYPDPLMCLLMIGTAAAVVRAVPRARLGWMAVAGLLLGLAFSTKLMEAALMAPAVLVTLLVCARATWPRRLIGVAVAGATAVAAGSFWILLVDLTPASMRPYVSSTMTNSAAELTFGYNGIERVSGLSRSLGRRVTTLFSAPVGPLISAFLPAAVLGLVLLTVLAVRGRRWSRRMVAVLLFGTWLLVGAAVLSYAGSRINIYYPLVIAAPTAALVGLTLPVLWRTRRRSASAAALAVGVLIGAGWCAVLLTPVSVVLGTVVAGVGCAAAVVVVLTRDVPRSGTTARISAVAVAVALFAAPAVLSVRQSGDQVSRTPAGASQPALLALIAGAPARYRWAAAVEGGNAAAGLELQTRRAVLDLGGYYGSFPYPVPAAFRSAVAHRQIRYLVVDVMAAAGHRGRNTHAAVIDRWADSHFARALPIHPTTWSQPYQVWDLAHPIGRAAQRTHPPRRHSTSTRTPAKAASSRAASSEAARTEAARTGAEATRTTTSTTTTGPVQTTRTPLRHTADVRGTPTR